MASILLAALLELDVNLKTGVANFSTRQDVPLTVYITNRNIEQTSELTIDEKTLHKSIEDEQLLNESAPGELARSQQGQTPGDPVDSSVHPELVRDWYGLLEQSARASVDEYFRREDVRATMWRQTQSVMFRPESDSSVVEEELLADLEFRQPVGVLGLGITVGSCFIGIPVAGVPVEERTVAITLFVCRNDSG